MRNSMAVMCNRHVGSITSKSVVHIAGTRESWLWLALEYALRMREQRYHRSRDSRSRGYRYAKKGVRYRNISLLTRSRGSTCK